MYSLDSYINFYFGNEIMTLIFPVCISFPMSSMDSQYECVGITFMTNMIFLYMK